MSDKPLVSVCLITYNHVNFIRQAIDSVLMQKFEGNWEFIIADDYSSDGTREILVDYQSKYPQLIKLMLQQKNVGPALNWIDLVAAANGKYISYIEGDDYWIDPSKIQEQLNFMRQNPSCNLLFGNAYLLRDESTSEEIQVKKTGSGPILLEELSNLGTVPSCTFFFKSEVLFSEFSALFKDAYFGDGLLFLLSFNNGHPYFLNRVWGVYRVGHASKTSRGSEEYFLVHWIPTLKKVFPYMNMENIMKLKKYFSIQYERLAGIYFKKGRLFLTSKYFIKSLLTYPFKSYREYADTYHRVFKS